MKVMKSWYGQGSFLNKYYDLHTVDDFPEFADLIQEIERIGLNYYGITDDGQIMYEIDGKKMEQAGYVRFQVLYNRTNISYGNSKYVFKYQLKKDEYKFRVKIEVRYGEYRDAVMAKNPERLLDMEEPLRVRYLEFCDPKEFERIVKKNYEIMKEREAIEKKKRRQERIEKWKSKSIIDKIKFVLFGNWFNL